MDYVVVAGPLLAPLLASAFALMVGTFGEHIDSVPLPQKYWRIAQHHPVTTAVVVIVYTLLLYSAALYLKEGAR